MKAYYLTLIKLNKADQVVVPIKPSQASQAVVLADTFQKGEKIAVTRKMLTEKFQTFEKRAVGSA